MSELVAIEFGSPEGETLRFEWDEEGLSSLDTAIEDPEPLWHLVGEIDWDEIEAIRVISGRFEDEGTLAVAAIRPAGADGHGAEVATGVLSADGQLESLPRALISTEYEPGGKPRRIGLELEKEGERMPMRVAGDVTGSSELVDGGVRRLRSLLALRSAGTAGTGVYEQLTLA